MKRAPAGDQRSQIGHCHYGTLQQPGLLMARSRTPASLSEARVGQAHSVGSPPLGAITGFCAHSHLTIGRIIWSN
jgi:hypothetical protein